MMSSPPWMPLYVGDYLADTCHLSTTEHGAYLLLIMHYWRTGALPANDKHLAGIARLSVNQWRKIRPTIQAFFEIRDDRWYHGRIVKELIAVREKYEKRSRAGVEGARAKWGEITGSATRSERLANARQIACHTDAEWLAMVGVFGCCVKCGVKSESLYGSMFCKDHIVPISRGGSDGIDNIQPMCRECNSKKGGSISDYRNKRLPDWRERLAKRLANACVMPENHNHIKKEKVLTSSDALGASRDIRADLFSTGLRLLAEITGKTPDSCRSLLGKWLKLVEDEAIHVLAAIEDAHRNRVADPVPWIAERLRPRAPNGVRTNGHKQHPADRALQLADDMERALERKVDATGDFAGGSEDAVGLLEWRRLT